MTHDERADRVLIYSHDTYGLGHLRRCLLIAERLLRDRPRRSVLVATGSPRAVAFEFTPGLDLVKLPCVIKRTDGTYGSRSLRLEVDAVARLRSEILRAAAVDFRPDVVLVDHAPRGFMGEIDPLFDAFDGARRRPRFVLGLRDVVDDAEVVRVQWTREGVWRRLDERYDRVLVYGDRAVRTTADELGLAARLGDRLVATGYLARPLPPRPTRDFGPPVVLVTTGGGGDGHAVLRAYAAYLASLKPPVRFRSVIVTGPFLSKERAAEIRDRFLRIDAPSDVLEFTPDFDALLVRASALVAMAGYNTAVEALAARTPTMFVPRESPRREQEIRAARLTAVVPQFRCVPAEKLTPQVLGSFVASSLVAPPAPPCGLKLDGLDRVADVIDALASEDAPATAAAARRGA